MILNILYPHDINLQANEDSPSLNLIYGFPWRWNQTKT
jgi:hypothetical protein